MMTVRANVQVRRGAVSGGVERPSRPLTGETAVSPKARAPRIRRGSWGELRRDETAATSLEWALLLATVALPGYVTIRLALGALAGHYQMMTTINALPFP